MSGWFSRQKFGSHMPVLQPTPDHVLSQQIVRALHLINSAAVVDTLARNGYDPRYTYMSNIKNLTPGQRLVARAITVRFVPARPDAVADKEPGERSPEYAAFEMAGPGDVIVMESMGSKLMSVGGDIKFLRLKQRQVSGLVCDGGIRDMHVVKDYGPKMFGLDKTSSLGTRIGFPYETNGTVTVDGILVRPGDYIHADDDGVVVIPRGVALDIAQKAIEYDDLEEWIRRKLDGEGLSPGKYYPPDDETFRAYREWKSKQSVKPSHTDSAKTSAAHAPAHNGKAKPH